MNARSKVLLSVLVIAALIVILVRVVASTSSNETDAQAPATAVGGHAPGAPEIPLPTLTPIVAPAAAAVITADQARVIGLRQAGSSVDSGSVVVEMGRAGDHQLAQHDPDYPLWLVHAEGSFQPTYWRCCDPPPIYAAATFYIDAVNGTVMRVQLQQPIEQ